ncbi:MAG: hypothetical protein ACKOGA_22955, partial [Planctomycetaceae bacterium]
MSASGQLSATGRVAAAHIAGGTRLRLAGVVAVAIAAGRSVDRLLHPLDGPPVEPVSVGIV